MRSLRVLFLASRDWYNPATTGGDNTLWENARYLASVGHRVTFLTSRFPGARREETIDGIRVVRIGSLYSLWLRTFVYYMKNCRGRYDVVITEGFGGSRIPRLAPLYVKEPIVTAWHQVHRELFAAQYSKALDLPLNILERGTAWIHRNTMVQAYTADGKAGFESLGFKPQNVFVVPVSISDDWSLPHGASPTTEPNILWLGKFRRYKAPHHIVQAMPSILQKIPAARLTLAGRHDDRSYEIELKNSAHKLGVEPSVDFHFDITESEKQRLMAQTRVLVVPSSVEGFGIVVLEANAYGVPVVASSGVPEGAVRDGFNGLRYQFGQIHELSDAIVEVITNTSAYRELSRNAVSNVERYRWKRVGAEFERVVTELAAVRPLLDGNRN